jgi:hypothetical protein
MAFASGRQDEIGKIGSGEIIGNVGVVSSYVTFEENLKGGLFAKYNTTTKGIESIDGEASPVVAGVVKREVSSALEDSGLYKADNTIQVDVVESGLVTVEVVEGVTINKFDAVYVYNGATVANQGKATNDSTDAVLVDGYFYQEVDTNIWSIRLK